MRWMRVKRQKTLKEIAELARVSETRMNAIEKMERPKIYDTTMSGVATALGFEDVDALDAAWKNTPVKPLPRRGGYADGSAETSDAKLLRVERFAAKLNLGADVIAAHFADLAREPDPNVAPVVDSVNDIREPGSTAKPHGAHER